MRRRERRDALLAVSCHCRRDGPDERGLLAGDAIDAAEIHERVIARVCEEVGADLRDVEILEVDELGDT